MAHWPVAIRRHRDEARDLHLLESLEEPVDPGAAARMVAQATAANLPEGNKTAARYLADPARSFAIREARAGTIDGVHATFVWIGPKARRFERNDAAGARPSSGTTFAFATLPHPLPWAEAWPRPHWVPVIPDSALGHAEFDARYMIAGDAPARTFTPLVIERFLDVPDETFEWASISQDGVCVHGIHWPERDGEAESLVEFAVAVSRAVGPSA
jgi:hypothetical protein